MAHVHGLVAALEQQPLLRVHHAGLCPARREQPQPARAARQQGAVVDVE